MSLSTRSLACAVVLAVLLPVASIARAAWSTSAVGGPLAVTSGVLATPTGVVTAVGTCVRRTSVTVVVTWTATTSPFADGYEILRGTKKTGPFTSLGTVSSPTTTFTDATTGFSKPYYYVVEATRNAWRSPDAAAAKFTTPARLTCK